MDQIIHRVFRFDRFVLDLSRGCLRAGDNNIDLRPKAFDVLRHLVENAGQLVTKDALYRAVWSDVVVGDDSLAHCIHELRQVLGDSDHRLIKTVPRRGYLLDAPAALEICGETTPQPRLESPSVVAVPVGRQRRPLELLAAAAVIGIVVSAILLSMPRFISSASSTRGPLAALLPQFTASELFTAADAQRIAKVAEIKQLPLPAFQISSSSAGTPEARGFVGVWVSGSGWFNSNRQFMLIVTHVESDGTAEGYTIDGPPQPKSIIQDTANARPLTARISGNTLFYSGRNGDFAALLTPQNRIEFRIKYRDGRTGVVALDPAWTLVAAELAAANDMSSSH
jgi:DNA-binding winged helix-turn-helix (wHTH) protein